MIKPIHSSSTVFQLMCIFTDHHLNQCNKQHDVMYVHVDVNVHVSFLKHKNIMEHRIVGGAKLFLSNQFHKAIWSVKFIDH